MNEKNIEKLVVLARKVKDSIDDEGVATGKCYFDIQYLLGYISALEVDHPQPEAISTTHSAEINTVHTHTKNKYKPGKDHPWKTVGERSEHLEKIVNEDTPIVKRWARKHDSCIICGTTEKKHLSKGKCTTCYYLTPEQIEEKKRNDSPPEEKRTMAVPVGTGFCQNAACPDIHVLHHKKDMIQVEDLFFCRQSCANTVIEDGEEVGL